MKKVAKADLIRKIKQANTVCNMDFQIKDYGHSGYMAVSEYSDVHSPYGTLQDVWFWLDAFVQGWIIRLEMVQFEDVHKTIAEEIRQEKMKKRFKKKGQK